MFLIKAALNDSALAKDTKSIHEATMAGEMMLQVDSGASYLLSHKARLRTGGYHYLGDKGGKMFNGSILVVLAKIIKNVMTSTAEAAVARLFINAQTAPPERQCLIELAHPQPPMPLKTDSMTAQGILTGTITEEDRARQGQFNILSEPGKCNLADYPTKHHPGNHHGRVRPIYLYEPGKKPSTIQGCIEILSPDVGKQTTKPVAVPTGHNSALPPGAEPSAGRSGGQITTGECNASETKHEGTTSEYQHFTGSYNAHPGNLAYSESIIRACEYESNIEARCVLLPVEYVLHDVLLYEKKTKVVYSGRAPRMMKPPYMNKKGSVSTRMKGCSEEIYVTYRFQEDMANRGP
eukprot:jgi/Psemu1/14702/gm1.14702_g